MRGPAILDNSKDMQIVDPWHQGAAFVSAEWPRKPIAGLAPAKYGCVNIPWYTGEAETNPTERIAPVFLWRDAGYKQSNILVFEEMRTVLQDKYESTWTSSITDGYKFFCRRRSLPYRRKPLGYELLIGK